MTGPAGAAAPVTPDAGHVPGDDEQTRVRLEQHAVRIAATLNTAIDELDRLLEEIRKRREHPREETPDA